MRQTGLRPLSVGEILDVSIKVYRQLFATLAAVVAVVTVPIAVIELVVQLSVLPTENFSFSANPLRPGSVVFPSAARVATTLGGGLVLVVLGLLASQLAIAGCTKAIADGYLGGHPTWQDSLRFGASRLGSLVWLTILTGAGLLLAFLCLVVPGIWLYAAWGVAVPALLLEGRRGTGALGRSFRLVRGRWWATAAVLLVATVLRSVVSDVVGGVIDGIVLLGQHSTVLSTLVGEIVSAGLTIVLTPFVAAVAVVLYVDLRVRKEGFDLQLLAQSVGTDGPAGPPPGFLPPTYPGPFPGGGPWGPQGGPWGPGPGGPGGPWGAGPGGPGGPWGPSPGGAGGPSGPWGGGPRGPSGPGGPWGGGPGGPGGPGRPPEAWGSPPTGSFGPTTGGAPTPPAGTRVPPPGEATAPPPGGWGTPPAGPPTPPSGTAWTMPASARATPKAGPPTPTPTPTPRTDRATDRPPTSPPSLLPPDWRQPRAGAGGPDPMGPAKEARGAAETRDAWPAPPAVAREPGGVPPADREPGDPTDPDGGDPSLP